MADESKIRFQVELEFVQMLGSVRYLQYLAHQGYYEDERFMRYLKYLTYWQQPAYARYLRYPICLDFLELLLEKESFRMAVKGDQYARMTEEQVLLQWTFRAKNDATYAPEPATVAVTATP